MKICYHLFTFIVPNLYEFFFVLFTNVGNQIVADSHGGKKNTMEVNGYRQLLSCKHSQNKWRNFHFWVNYDFKLEFSHFYF